jgi:tetratricopeptide (TPR) repeat protein
MITSSSWCFAVARSSSASIMAGATSTHTLNGASSSSSLSTTKMTDRHENGSEKITRGVSVHYLRTTFINEVKKYNANGDDNHTANKNIYEIEDLRDTKYGLIRQKGEHIYCPRDGRLGAAYVDCLDGRDNVGKANVMLSYGWGNTVADIVDVLVAHCEKKDLDPKSTYVWICCLCNNQHRVAESNVPFEELKDNFANKVETIGSVVALLAPWDKALYLTRVWCIFELFTANECDGCNLNIEMPAREKLAFKINVFSNPNAYNTIYNTLGGTNIQNAEASIEEDKINILRLVEEGCGAEKLNIRVNVLLRKWLQAVLVESIYDLDNLVRTENLGGINPAVIANAYQYLGGIFLYNHQLKLAMDCFQKQRRLSEAHFETNDIKTAQSYNNIALVHRQLKEFDEAIDFMKKNIAIKEEVYGNDHLQTSTSYRNIGRAYKAKGELDVALDYYQKCRVIRERDLGLEHRRTSAIYNSIGGVYVDKGELDEALIFYKKSLEIKEEVLKQVDENPKTATSYNNIGLVYNKKGEYDDALEYYVEALRIREKVLGRAHPFTLQSYKHISLAYEAKGDTERALVFMIKHFLGLQNKRAKKNQ